MALKFPTSAKEVSDRSKADVQRELATSNPFLRNSWLGAIVTSAANRIFDFYLQLKVALRESFPDTATGTYLTRWAAIWGKQIIAASKANGIVVATGTAVASIPISTIMTVSGVGNFISTAAGTISANKITVTSLVLVGQTATAKASSSHGLANNVSVTISGAADSAYNITASITVTAADEFEYTIAGTPVDETGITAAASYVSGSIPIESVDFGADTNIDAGTELTLQSPIVNVDDTLAVNFDAVGGGTNEETQESLRLRMLSRIQNPVANFNVAEITDKAKQIAGVTRVFVQEVTPALGQVTIYFMRDGDSSRIPSGSEVTKVKNNILTIKPASTSSVDVIVLSPTAVVVDFTFTAIFPNTSTMQAAIKNSLGQFFDERTNVGVVVDEDAYRSAIFNTIDTVTGDRLSTFTITAPAGDVAVTTGDIAILGNVVFS